MNEIQAKSPYNPYTFRKYGLFDEKRACKLLLMLGLMGMRVKKLND